MPGHPGVCGTPRCVRDPSPGLTHVCDLQVLVLLHDGLELLAVLPPGSEGTQGVTRWSYDLCGSPGATPSPPVSPSPTCVPQAVSPAPPLFPAQVFQLLPLLLCPFQVLQLLQPEPTAPVGGQGAPGVFGQGQRSCGHR